METGLPILSLINLPTFGLRNAGRNSQLVLVDEQRAKALATGRRRPRLDFHHRVLLALRRGVQQAVGSAVRDG